MQKRMFSIFYQILSDNTSQNMQAWVMAMRRHCPPSRWSGDVMKRPGHNNFNAVSHNRSRSELLFFNLTWRSRGQISSVLLQLLLFAFSNRKFGRHGKWSVTFWQWENNTKDRTWLWDTALKFFGRAFSLRH